MGLGVIVSVILFVSFLVLLHTPSTNSQIFAQLPENLELYEVDDPKCLGGRAKENYFHYDPLLGNCSMCRSRCSKKSATDSRNNFSNRDDCMRTCVCRAGRGKIDVQLRPRAMFRMWYFNKDANACEEFIWVGERGNANRFIRKEECESTCMSAGA